MTSIIRVSRTIHYYLSIKTNLLRTSAFSTSGPRYKSEDVSESQTSAKKSDPISGYCPNTPAGMMERTKKPDKAPMQPVLTPYPPYPDGKNPKTGEVGGPGGPEPTRFGDWERKGRVTDF